ncbi:hypothetical protein Tco_0363450 [Tanacetum coccineum]
MGYSLIIQVPAQKAKKDWVKELCVNNKVNFMSLQETKIEIIELFNIKMCWGNFAFDYVYSSSIGYSGGILYVWDPRMFHKINSTVSDYFVMIRGEWVPNGDFNEVRKQAERYGSIFNMQGADAFNSFILAAGLEERMSVSKSLQDLDKLESIEVAQKAKIKWAIEGDENSKYYHGILNKKRSQLAPQVSRLQLDMEFPNKLNLEQHVELEKNVTREEIKRAVWDRGVDKSPGPDGFTFGFYRRYWSFMEKDVEEAIYYFFQYGVFPKGGNSSFIALILKMHDAKMVKDFRPIC